MLLPAVCWLLLAILESQQLLAVLQTLNCWLPTLQHALHSLPLLPALHCQLVLLPALHCQLVLLPAVRNQLLMLPGLSSRHETLVMTLCQEVPALAAPVAAVGGVVQSPLNLPLRLIVEGQLAP